MLNQTAQFLWVGSTLSPLETLCLKSFIELSYTVHLYVYEAVSGVPVGVQLKDAREIIPEADVFLGPGAAGGSYANFSDRFRYHLLYRKGGWWFDTDHIALQILPEPTDLLIASQWEGKLGEYATPSALWCKPGDVRMKWLRDECDKILRSGVEREFTTIGPKLVNELVEKFTLRANVAPWWEFNPYPYYYIHRLAYRSNQEWLFDKFRFAVHLVRQATKRHFRAAYIRPGTRAIHLSNEIWRAEKLDKFALYHPGCIYGRLQRKYGFEPALISDPDDQNP